MNDPTRRTSTGTPLSGSGATRSPGLSAPASPSMPSMRSAPGVGKPPGPSAAMRASNMATSVTSAAPKAPPAPTGTAPVGAPRVPSAARVAQGRAATELGGVAGAAVAVDGFKQLKNADNVGLRLAGEAPSAAPGTPPPSALAPMSRVAASTASTMDAANAPTPFTRPRASGQPGRIESAAMQAGLGVVGMAYGGDPDVIGGGARPIYGVTLPAGPDLALSEAIGPTSHAGYGAAGTPQPLGPIARAARHHLGTASTGSRGALSITGAGETGPVGAAVVDITPEQMLGNRTGNPSFPPR